MLTQELCEQVQDGEQSVEVCSQVEFFAVVLQIDLDGQDAVDK